MIARAVDDKDAGFNEMMAAADIITAAMAGLMNLREKILARMRATGEIR